VEVVADDRSSTFRAVYTVKFADVVYVLHCFQKKSKSGIKTPKEDMELINFRLKSAKLHFEAWQATQGKSP
jgi:phage-related protein